MKNILFLIAIFGVMLCSCGNKAKQNNGELDSTEQKVLADSVVAQLDSMAKTICELAGQQDISKLFTKDNITITTDLKKVKPDYLITENDIKDLTTIQQKYVALAYLCVDNNVQQMYYSSGDAFYNNAMARLATETSVTNSKEAKAAENAPLSIENTKKFYGDMKARNSLDLFYAAQAAYMVEALYIISRNVDIYMPAINDQTAENLSKRLATVIYGVNLISANHPEMKPVSDALASINGINATTSAQFKEQIAKANVSLTKAREALLKA